MKTYDDVVWDPFAAEAVADPPASWRMLRENAPVAWSERQGGFWVVSRYEDAVEIARDAARFSNSGGPQFGTPRPPLEVDRPTHTLFRRILQPYFTKERVALLEPRVRVYVGEMLQPAIDAGDGDLARALTYPLPARVLCAWLGLPDTEWSYLKGVAEELFDAEEGRGDDPTVRARCNEELYAYSRRIVGDRVGDLVHGLLEADGVTEEDVVQVVRLLIVAGHNSTTGALGNCILRLATHADLQRHLRRHPEALPAAIEEFLRLDPSVQAMPRWANEDTELRGCPVRKGEKVMLLWASANRDASHFDRPDECILGREPNDHLTFGRGIHRCIGMDLARLELRVALEELLGRTSSFELSGLPIRTTFIRRGVSYLPVALHA
jgi:cytochrome P450